MAAVAVHNRALVASHNHRAAFRGARCRRWTVGAALLGPLSERDFPAVFAAMSGKNPGLVAKDKFHQFCRSSSSSSAGEASLLTVTSVDYISSLYGSNGESEQIRAAAKSSAMGLNLSMLLSVAKKQDSDAMEQLAWIN